MYIPYKQYLYGLPSLFWWFMCLRSALARPADTARWASYQIHKIAGCACAGNAGNVFPCRRFPREPIVSDPAMHHGTCVTHVPWCMSGSLTCGDGENVPGIPGACAPAILRIWQEAHGCESRATSRRTRECTEISDQLAWPWARFLSMYLGPCHK